MWFVNIFYLWQLNDILQVVVLKEQFTYMKIQSCSTHHPQESQMMESQM